MRTQSGSVLGSGAQRHDRCAHDGGHCPVGDQSEGDGEVYDSLYLRVVGWIATVVMFGVSMGIFVTWK